MSQLDLILPEEIYTLVLAHIHDSSSAFGSQYAHVHMKLSEILAVDFFTEYIKKGNIMMLSEGRPLVDNTFSLYEGVLRLELDRPTYEKCGLQGKPMEDGGRKHQKARWAVEFDLRSPSMLHGKKGFGRLEWAAKNVLDQSLTWLFYNFNPSAREALRGGRERISQHAPSIKDIRPKVAMVHNVLTPILTVGCLPACYEQEDAMALLEWIHLIALSSPRLLSTDNIDPFLSRYEVPTLMSGSCSAKPLTSKTFAHLRWTGFIPPQFVRVLFLLLRKEGLKVAKEDHDGEGGTESGEEDRWFALSAKGFGEGEAYTVMQWAGKETFTWEVL
jgi:ribonuclease P/MRP protein subunit RPP40